MDKDINLNADNLNDAPIEIKMGGNDIDGLDSGSCEVSAENEIEYNCSNVTTISATSKISCELSGVWYAFTYSEVRHINDDSNMELERQKLWDTVNVEVDKQCQDVIDMIKNPGQPA